MKYFLIFITFITLSFTSFAQKSIDYPRFDIDSNGEKVVVMTIKQAQSLDNQTDLLILMEKANSQIGEYDSVCLKVINDKENVIASQKIEISKLKESLSIKEQNILSLNSEINNYIKKVDILEKEVTNRQSGIDEKNHQIRKLKTKIVLGGSGGAVAIIALIVSVIFN